jgi:hypothetical protein
MTQHFLLPCSCGQKVRVGNAQAGGQVICACGKSVSVPTLRGLRQLEPAPVEVIGKTALQWSPVHGAAFAGALLLATAGAALMAYHLFYYSQLVGWVGNEGYDYTTDRSADMIRGAGAQIDKEVDTLTPEETLAKLRETEAEGLGEKGSLPWVVLKERATGHLWWIKAGSGAFLVAAFVVLATLFVGRR